tara:strand:+ start:803 stop:1045 length:243 start_codon:yes stop_codon:yes gene_type:complete
MNLDWLTNFFTTKFWKKPEPEVKKETVVIDMMKDDVDPDELTVENAYKTRWIWYHTILAIGIFVTNVLLIAILTVLAIKL